MSDDAVELVQKYVSAWNIPDGSARRAVIDEVFTENGIYADPNIVAEGASAIDAYIGDTLKQTGGLEFALVGSVDVHHDLARFAWSFGPAGGVPVASGLDVAVLEKGAIKALYGFFD